MTNRTPQEIAEEIQDKAYENFPNGDLNHLVGFEAGYRAALSNRRTISEETLSKVREALEATISNGRGFVEMADPADHGYSNIKVMHTCFDWCQEALALLKGSTESVAEKMADNFDKAVAVAKIGLSTDAEGVEND